MKQTVKERIGISRKIMAIYISVLIVEILLFILSLAFTMKNVKRDATYSLIESRLRYTQAVAERYGITQIQNLAGDDTGSQESAELYISDEFDNGYLVELEFLNYIEEADIPAFVQEIKAGEYESKSYFSSPKGNVYFEYITLEDESKPIILVASAGEFFDAPLAKNLTIIIILFLIIYTVGAVVVFVFIRKVAKRINRLCDFVASMPEKGYRESFLDDGDDVPYNDVFVMILVQR